MRDPVIGPQAMVHEEASRPVHDHVLAVRTSFLDIVRGLEKSGHIVLGLLVAATAAGCWAGVYWGQYTPAMTASVVVTLLYTLLRLLDQKQAAALTCCGGWVLVNTLFLALTLSCSSDVLAQLLEAVTAPSMLAVLQQPPGAWAWGSVCSRFRSALASSAVSPAPASTWPHSQSRAIAAKAWCAWRRPC